MVYFKNEKCFNNINGIENIILFERKEVNNKIIYLICKEAMDNYYYAVLKLIEKICDMEKVTEIISKFKCHIISSETFIYNLISCNQTVRISNSQNLNPQLIVYYQYYSFCFNNFVGRKTFEKTTDIMENFLKLINCNEFFYKKYKQKQYKGELPFFVPGIRIDWLECIIFWGYIQKLLNVYTK